MTATATIPDRLNDHGDRIARLEVREIATRETVEKIDRNVSRILWGIISVLLAVVGQLVFKR